MMMPQPTFHPQQGYQREVSQTMETTEQKTGSMFQKFQQQQRTEKYGYTNGVNGHTTIIEVSKPLFLSPIPVITALFF